MRNIVPNNMACCLIMPRAEESQADQEACGSLEDNWTLAEALRTPILWVFIAARILPSAWGTGLILHQVSIFAVLDHSAQVATETFRHDIAFRGRFGAAGGLYD